MAGTWTPTWQANTDYSLTAVVIPTSFGGYTWRCTTAGTSGGSEPAWPDPLISPTVSDGSVTWSVGTGFRQAIQSGLLTVLQAFAAANPTILRMVMTVRPRSLTTADMPLFYLGDMNETIDTSQGHRTRTFSGFAGYYVDTMGEQIESNDRLNFAADVLADLFTDNFHAANGRSLFAHVGTNDTEIEDNSARYPALEFLFGPTEITEGRT